MLENKSSLPITDDAVGGGERLGTHSRHPFIAHHRESDNEEQALATHLSEVANLCQLFADKVDLPHQGELIGLLHDLGKYSLAFQTYIKSATGIFNPDEDAEYVDATALKGKIDHSSAGAQLIWQALSKQGTYGGIAGQILALCIASHHSGLIDCLGMDAQSEAMDVFSRRMQKADALTFLAEAQANMDAIIKARMDALLAMPELISGIRQRITAIAKLEKDQQILQFKVGLLTRFLFACLIDADRISSADFEKPKAAKFRPHGQYENWTRLAELLEQKLASFEAGKSINQLRAQIALQCLQKASGPRGVYTLSVPTGGGKTFASLRFALQHANLHGMDRIIYAIPFTSIIDQNAREARLVLEPEGVAPGSVVLEAHSNLMPDKLGWKTKLISDNWDAPIIYTTNVQILETLFGGGTRSVRRLHQLANSIIVFDEIQTLPIKCIHMFCNAINFLVEHCNATVVLCTATQPLIDRVAASKGAIRKLAEGEIMHDVDTLFNQLQRVQVQDRTRSEGWSNEELADLAMEQANASGSCLTIFNTKKMAQALFELCSKNSAFDVYHLSTNMCPKHRRAILDQILVQLKHGGEAQKPVLCISTQLIEAGVDCDFGSVIRSLAGLDSIAQAAGRCNRHGLRPLGVVTLVNPNEERTEKLEDIAAGQSVTKRILHDFAENPDQFDRDLIGLKAIESYFAEYFSKRAPDMAYSIAEKSNDKDSTRSAIEQGRDDNLLNMLGENVKVVADYKRINQSSPPIFLRQSFMAAAKAFKVIDAPTRGVIVPYGAEGEDLINELKSAYMVEKQIDLLRRAQQFTVNVFPNDLKELLDQGALRPIQKDIDILYLDTRYYYNDFGLGLTAKPMEVYLV